MRERPIEMVSRSSPHFSDRYENKNRAISNAHVRFLFAIRLRQQTDLVSSRWESSQISAFSRPRFLLAFLDGTTHTFCRLIHGDFSQQIFRFHQVLAILLRKFIDRQAWIQISQSKVPSPSCSSCSMHLGALTAGFIVSPRAQSLAINCELLHWNCINFRGITSTKTTGLPSR